MLTHQLDDRSRRPEHRDIDYDRVYICSYMKVPDAFLSLT